MKKGFYHIKKRDSGAVVRLVVFILFDVVAIACALGKTFFTQIASAGNDITTAVTVVGIAATCYFSFMTAYSIYRLIDKPDAIIISNSGYYDFITVPKKGLFIPWRNTDNVKVFGTKREPLLGVYLADPEKLILELDEEIADEIRANLEMGLPPLLYREDEIEGNLQDVLMLFMKRIDVSGIQVDSGDDTDDTDDKSDYVIPDFSADKFN